MKKGCSIQPPFVLAKFRDPDNLEISVLWNKAKKGGKNHLKKCYKSCYGAAYFFEEQRQVCNNPITNYTYIWGCSFHHEGGNHPSWVGTWLSRTSTRADWSLLFRNSKHGKHILHEIQATVSKCIAGLYSAECSGTLGHGTQNKPMNEWTSK